MPTIRPFTREESVEFNTLCSLCFGYTLDEKNRYAREHEIRCSHALFDDAGKIQGGFYAFDFRTVFCGREVCTAGVGGVVSRPEQRRQGTIRKLFEQVLPELYEGGVVFSALYPFSHVYYRKFGYEQCLNRLYVRFPLEALQGLKSVGKVSQLLPGDDMSELKALYERYARRYDYAFLRVDAQFEPLLEKDPTKDLQYIYLWRDDAGVAQGYAVCKTQVDSPHEKTMNLLEMVYLTPEALHGLLAFFRNFGGHGKFTWKANPDAQLKQLLPEPCVVETLYGNDGMMRVVNVEKALSMLPASPVDGRFTVQVLDEQIAPNNATFAVECRGGELAVSRVNEEADLVLPVHALAPLVLGSQPFAVYRMSNLAHTLRREDPTMRYVFGQRMNWMNDLY